MESPSHDLGRFLQLLQSFQCQKVPCDLLIRACESRPTWSSTGEIVDRLPLEEGVSEWLVDFYNVNKPFLNGTEPETHKGNIEYTTGFDGVGYLKLTNERQPDLGDIDERILARERISIVLQAFPSINAEITGEEIIERLMNVVKTSILPLLSSLAEADIEDWLLPTTLRARDSFLFSMIEFLYQVIDRLGIENPLIPMPLLGQIPTIIASQKVTNLSFVLSKISQALDTHNGTNVLQSSFWSSGTGTDQRSNALIGHVVEMLLSNEGRTGRPKASAESLARALSNWRPLSLGKPSTMEYLATTSFGSPAQISMTGKPSFGTVDTIALQGLLLSRRRRHKDATEFLSSTIATIISHYGPCSMQLGIVTAELANCYNFLRREALAELTLTKSLELRLDPNLSSRRDGIYLRLALADSYIGQARYQDAVPVLQHIIDDPNISATYRMMSALRLTRSRRRMHEDARKAFEQKSPLWICLRLLDNVPDILVMEFVEELGCSISELPKRKLEDSKNPRELMEAVNSALGTSSSVTNSPCWEWYTKCQEEYSGQITEATKEKKGKRVNEVLSNEIPDRVGTPITTRTSSCLSPQEADGMTVDEGPWSERLVLSFDGGGVSAISSLLILKRIMYQIQVLELTHPDGPVYSSSDSSWSPRDKRDAPLKIPEKSDMIGEFFPCHYFDYVAGLLLGGLNSIMLGRLRMSVDQAIDNFIDFCNTVFGRPRLFHRTSSYFSSPQYPVANFDRALSNIIANGFADTSGEGRRRALTRAQLRFQENRGGIRTIAICETKWKEHMWRSYDDGVYTSTYEVARATSAMPDYIDEIRVNDATYWGGFDIVANNPSYKVLKEVLAIHSKIPAVFVNIGTGTQVNTDLISLSDRTWQDLRWRDRLQQPNIIWTKASTELHFDNETEKWLELAKEQELEDAYRLSAGNNLDVFPYDHWQPAGTGKKTLHEITDITKRYLDTDEVRETISRIARKAVRIRRARARTEQWKDFV